MNPSAHPYCTTTLNYANGDASQPVAVTIGDAREAIKTLQYESCGFTLLEHRSEVNDWQDAMHVADVHMAEIKQFALEHTGCDHALVYPPLVRSPRTAREIADYAPIEFVHSDYTDDYRAMIQDPDRPYGAFIAPALETAGVTQDEIVDADRVMMLQLWRNIGAERPDYPLALCDAATVPRSHLYPFVVPQYGGIRLEFEAFGVHPPADPDEHHWYTFPSMQHDEVVAFRTYDSRCAEENRPFWTPHTAFRDPHAGPDAPQRESVEMRVLCLFGL